jgi:hypothetical protein
MYELSRMSAGGLDENLMGLYFTARVEARMYWLALDVWPL